MEGFWYWAISALSKDVKELENLFWVGWLGVGQEDVHVLHFLISNNL